MFLMIQTTSNLNNFIKKRKGLPILLKKHLEKVATIFVLIMFTLYNYIFTPGYRYYEFVKYTVFVSLLLLSLFLMIIISIVYRITQPKWALRTINEYLHNIYIWEYSLMVYLFIGFISALHSDNPLYAFIGLSARNEGWLILACYAITFFMVSRSYQPRIRDFIIFAISCSILALYGIGQYFGFDPLNLGKDIEIFTHKYLINFYATLSNTNAASALLTLCLMISSVLFMKLRTPKKWIFFICILIVFMVLCLGKTESGMVGMIISFLLIFPFLVKNKNNAFSMFLLLGSLLSLYWIYLCIYAFTALPAQGNPSPTWLELRTNPFLWGAIASFILSLLFFAFRNKKMGFTISQKIWQRVWWLSLLIIAIGFILLLPTIEKMTSSRTIKQLSEIMQGNIQDSMGSNRIYVWRRALKIYEEHPFLGVGPDRFYAYFVRDYGAESLALYNFHFDKAHSEYLQTLVDMGPFALISLFSFYGLLLFKAKNYIENPLILSVIAALLCFLIQAFFNFSQPISTPVVWVIWGILGALIRNENTINSDN